MSDWCVVLMAAATALGALTPRPLPLAVAALPVAVGLAARRPTLVVVGVFVAASLLSFRAWDGLAPAPAGPVEGTATLVSDPERFGNRVRADVRVRGRRYEGWADGDAGALIAARLAGERVRIAGHAAPPGRDARMRLAVRHVASRLEITAADPAGAGTPPARIANRLRRLLDRGATSLDRTTRSLLTGIVLGDDRDQPPEVDDDFRAAGMSHLLAVSGQNVAFVVALFAPMFRRLPLASRTAAGVAIVALFGLMTRWEPSVVRAVAMTVLTIAAAAAGRPQPGFRVLAIAVTGAILVDPLLVHRVGFLLSVGACAGIAALSGPIASALPGPRPLADAAGVTIAAQVGVAPVLIPMFGPMPVVAIPANVLAVPVAGPLMMWGMTAGLAAGALGGGVAAALHVPTRAMVGWIAGVARVAAGAPLGRITALHVAAAVAVVGLWRLGMARRVVVATAAITLAAATIPALRPVGAPASARGPRVEVAGSAAVVVTDGSDSTVSLLAAVRRHNLRRPSLVVVTGGGRAAAAQVAPFAARARPRLLLVPASVVIPGARVVDEARTLLVGALAVDVAPAGTRLRVEVRHRRATVAGDAAAPR